MGWAATSEAAVQKPVGPATGVIRLPGPGDLPTLYMNVHYALADLLEGHKPGELVYAPALIGGVGHTQTKALNGVEAVALLTACGFGVKTRPIAENKARKAILRRPAGADWKAAALAWCDRHGWQHGNDDNIADACVLWAFRQRLLRIPLAGELL